MALSFRSRLQSWRVGEETEEEDTQPGPQKVKKEHRGPLPLQPPQPQPFLWSGLLGGLFKDGDKGKSFRFNLKIVNTRVASRTALLSGGINIPLPSDGAA